MQGNVAASHIFLSAPFHKRKMIQDYSDWHSTNIIPEYVIIW